MRRPTSFSTIFNDPVHGFVHIFDPLAFAVVEHPYFQRLRRILQLGVAFLVYPGGTHSRFLHALGCYHLMGRALQVLQTKGVDVPADQARAARLAILMHDIGHGPFSHALERFFIDAPHERISLALMELINEEVDGKLALAIELFQGRGGPPFLRELISSQLDVDRLDYLIRDSFFTGVSEGVIGLERILTMLTVADGHLAVEKKAIYSVEKFVVARRLMYWQVYLHKTNIAADVVLRKTLQRVVDLFEAGEHVPMPEQLPFLFRQRRIPFSDNPARKEVVHAFAQLDDYDILYYMKRWQSHSDPILSRLARMFVTRRLMRVKIGDRPIGPEERMQICRRIARRFEVSADEARYFFDAGELSNEAYVKGESEIRIVGPDGVADLATASDNANILALARPVVKYYVAYPKAVEA